MPLEIVSGRSKSGKSKYIYDKIRSLSESGEQVMLIVPEQYSHAAEKKLLDTVEAIKDNCVEVFSFNRLASTTRQRLGYPHVRKLDAVGKALIVRNVLNSNEFTFYRNACEQKGFVEMVSQTIGEFKKYMLLPELLSDTADNTDDEILAMKLRDLSVMYSEYEKAIAENYADSDDSLTQLTSMLSNTDIYKAKHIFFDEFSTFIPQELKVISALCSGSASVCVALCCDETEPNTTLFMPTCETINQLKKCTSSPVKITRLEGTRFDTAEMAFLEKYLYTFPSKKFSGDCENIKVYALANPRSEVEICAANISMLVREQGYMYKDIGVICSDIDMYERHIEHVFELNNIEYFTDNKNDIINHHLIRFVLGLLETYIQEYNYASVFNYLKASFINADPGSIAVLEKYIQRTNLKRTTWLNDEKWQKLLDANYSDDDNTKASLCKIRSDYILPLANMHEKIKGRHKVSDNAHALYDLIVELKLPQTIASYIKMFNDEHELRYAKEYEKIWEIIVSTLDEIVDLNGDMTVNVTEFYNLLVTAFSQHKVGFIPSAVDRVIIGNTERTRADGLKALFVLGVNEGVFPMASKPDGILGDSDKDSLKECGIDFSTTSTIAAFYSQFCAYSAFTMPSRKLFVSYSKAGNDFKALRKSYIVDRILKIFSISEISETSITEACKLASKHSAKEILARSIADYRDTMELDMFWRSVYKYFEQNSDFADKIGYFLKSDNIAHNLSDKNLKKLVDMLSYTSVSKIERYMACKYAYFIDYILRIDWEKETRVDALDIGNITHSVLESLSRELGSSKASLESADDEYVLKRTEELIAEYLDDFSYKTDDLSAREQYVITRLKNSIYICFNAIRSQFLNSKFEPLGYEIEFKDGSELGSIELETPGGNKINLTGKIDRADIYNDGGKSYIRVVDYKTGAKEFKLDDVFYGLSVQLMVYLNKLVSSKDEYTYGGALYFPVVNSLIRRDGHTDSEAARAALSGEIKLKGIVPYEERLLDAYDEKFAASLRHGSAKKKRVSPQGFETIDKYLGKKLGSICDNILNGDISISPSKKGDYTPCDYCKYSSVCRFDPTVVGNEYKLYKAIPEYEEIIKEMEEAINVDRKSTDCD